MGKLNDWGVDEQKSAAFDTLLGDIFRAFVRLLAPQNDSASYHHGLDLSPSDDEGYKVLDDMQAEAHAVAAPDANLDPRYTASAYGMLEDNGL